jgi:urease accessory protein
MLQAFRSVAVVREIHRVESLPATARGYARAPITLGWEDRLKVRGRRKSDAGVEFAVALPRGTVLREGDCLILDEAALVLIVVERMEAVFVVEPRTRREWGLFAYHIGNSHQPVMVTDTAIVCPDQPGMEPVLRYHAIPFTRAVRAFTPVSLSGAMDGAPPHRHEFL